MSAFAPYSTRLPRYMTPTVSEMCSTTERSWLMKRYVSLYLSCNSFSRLMLTFSAAQKKLLVALARERTREFDDAYRRRYRLGPSSTVNSSKRKLLEDGHIEQIATECRIADPFFAEFLRLV